MKNLIDESTPNPLNPDSYREGAINQETENKPTPGPIEKPKDNTIMIIAILALIILGGLMIANYLNNKNKKENEAAN